MRHPNGFMMINRLYEVAGDQLAVNRTLVPIQKPPPNQLNLSNKRTERDIKIQVILTLGHSHHQVFKIQKVMTNNPVLEGMKNQKIPKKMI